MIILRRNQANKWVPPHRSIPSTSWRDMWREILIEGGPPPLFRIRGYELWFHTLQKRSSVVRQFPPEKFRWCQPPNLLPTLSMEALPWPSHTLHNESSTQVAEGPSAAGTAVAKVPFVHRPGVSFPSLRCTLEASRPNCERWKRLELGKFRVLISAKPRHLEVQPATAARRCSPGPRCLGTHARHDT